MSVFKLLRWRAGAALSLIALFVALGVLSETNTVLAHEGRDIGDYNFVIGFINEPAIEGLLNGVSIRITSLKTEDHGDGHGDGHGDDAAKDSSSNTEIDLITHGAVFVDELAADNRYEFTFGPEFEGLTVPFHAHPVENDGSIIVSPDNPASDVVVVEIHEDGFKPSRVLIQPGTTIAFENHMTDPTVVMSGPLGQVAAPTGSPAAKNAVTGLTTLQAEVTHMASSISQIMPLKEAFGSPGQYKAEFIPTSTGGYRFRIFGDIEGTAIDATFESSNTTFDEVTPASEVQFPIKLVAPRETENAARGALEAATEAGSNASDANSAASTATLLGIIALILGLGGLVLGGLAFRRSGQNALPDRH